MTKVQQIFVDVRLGSEVPTLTDALMKLVAKSRAEYQADYVEVHQVVSHNAEHFTVICHLHNPKR